MYRICDPLARIFLGYRVYGEDQFPKAGGVIVAVNHTSNYDPVLVGIACPRQLAFLGKIELFKNPLLGSLLRHLGAIPLRRGAADSGALRAAVNVLNAGKPLLMFPEGTRSKTGELQRGRRGIGMLAVRSTVNIIPVYLSGSFHLFRNFLRRRVTVRFGECIDVKRYRGLPMTVKDIYTRIGQDTMACIKELKDAHHH